jgi:hypothetical protein
MGVQGDFEKQSVREFGLPVRKMGDQRQRGQIREIDISRSGLLAEGRIWFAGSPPSLY